MPSSVLQISTEEAGIQSNHHHYSIINYDLKKKTCFIHHLANNSNNTLNNQEFSVILEGRKELPVVD